jgi:hypothetical protein
VINSVITSLYSLLVAAVEENSRKTFRKTRNTHTHSYQFANTLFFNYSFFFLQRRCPGS